MFDTSAPPNQGDCAFGILIVEAIMGTEWKYNRKHLRRLKKSPGERRQREDTQRRRLVDLGVDPAKAKRMNGPEIRTLLRRPARLTKKTA